MEAMEGSYYSTKRTQKIFREFNLVVANCLSGALLFGLSMSSINGTKDFIAIQWNWCNPEDTAEHFTYKCSLGLSYSSAITVGVLVGAAAGSFIGGYVVSYGRLTGLYVMHCLFLIGNVLSGVSTNAIFLSIARIILGFGLGASTYVVPLYISEISPKARRGFVGVLFQLLITIGILAANLLALPMGVAPEFFKDVTEDTITPFKRWWWRFDLGMPAIFSVLSMLLHFFIFPYESPHYLIMKKRYDEAADFLRAIHRKDNVEEEYNEILEAIAESRRQESAAVNIFKAITSPHYYYVVLIGIALSSFQQLTGINLIITNSNRLFNSLNLTHIATIMSSVITAVNVLMTFPPIFLIDRLGRRTILMFGITGQLIAVGVGLIVNLVDESSGWAGWVSVVCTFLFIVSFAVGYGAVPWVYLHEIFPAEIKQSASSTATAFNWICAVVVVAASDYYLQQRVVFFAIFTATNIVAWFFIYFCIKETKGLSIDESPFFKTLKREALQLSEKPV